MNGTPHTCFKMALVFSDILEYSLGILLLFHFLKGSHHFKQENVCAHQFSKWWWLRPWGSSVEEGLCSGEIASQGRRQACKSKIGLQGPVGTQIPLAKCKVKS